MRRGKHLICLVLWLFLGGKAAFGYSSSDATTLLNAYTKAFYVVSGTNGYFKDNQSGGQTYFWGQAEEIECVIDAYECTSNTVYLGMITNLLNGFIKNNGSSWTSYTPYNDDVLWAVMAFTRGGRDTGKTNYCNLAKANFDAVYARGYDTKLGGGLYWQYPDNASKNACVSGPGAIAASLIYQVYGDTNYWNKATNLYFWERSKLFNASNGAIADNIGTNGVVNGGATTYNQGTFLGAANFIGQTNDAMLAANFTMLNMTSGGLLPQYGIANNNSGFNAIFLRWLSRFMRDRNLQANFEPWMQLNATAAWNSRRTNDNLSWCQWPLPSPATTNFYSWDCISSFEALAVATPPQNYFPIQGPGAAPAHLTATGGYGLVHLNWWQATGVKNYNVKRSLIDGGPYAILTNVTANAFTDTNVVNSRTYYYVVSALYAAGEGTNSAQVSTSPLAPVTWFRADAIAGLVNGAPLSLWPDASGNGAGALQNLRANQPTYIANGMNGLPVVRFNAANSSCLWFYPPVQNDFTIIVVFQTSQNNQGNGTSFWQGAGLVNGEQSGTVNDFGMQINSNGQVVAGTGNPDVSMVSSAGLNNGKPHVVTFKRTQSTGGLVLYRDGVQVALGTGGVNALTVPPALFLGAIPTGTGFFTGDIAEVQIYNAALANSDRLGLENALMCKYGLTGAHPAVPAGLAAAAGNRQVALNWNLTTGATGYNLWHTTDLTVGFQIAVTGIPTSSFVDTNAVSGRTNYYQITAVDDCGSSLNSATVAVFLPLPALAMSVSGAALTLTWPGWANDWGLFGATNLAPPVVWLPVTNTPGSNNSAFTVTLPIGTGCEYFRLSSP